MKDLTVPSPEAVHHGWDLGNGYSSHPCSTICIQWGKVSSRYSLLNRPDWNQHRRPLSNV